MGSRDPRLLFLSLAILALVVAMPPAASAYTPPPSHRVGLADAPKQYVQGVLEGRATASLIRDNVASMLSALRERGVDINAVYQEAEKWFSNLPSYVALELRGLADGSGVGLRDIVLLNYAGESLFGEECTAAVIAPNLTQTHTPIIWKNRDVGYRWVQHQVITVVNDGQGYRFVAITTAGYWGVAMGVNEKGLAVVNTAVSVKYSNPNPRWGNLDLIRLILYNASTVEEAYRLLNSTVGKYSGSSFLVVDPHKAAVIDVVGDHLQVITYASSFLVRTNHWVGVAPKELWPYQKHSYSNSSSTVQRYMAAYKALVNLSSDGVISFKDMLELARNTGNGYSYNSPCRFPKHPGAPKEAVREAATVSSAIISPDPNDPGLTVMWASLGNPLTTLFIPVSVTLSNYTTQSVELRNPSTDDEWMFKLLASAEPWLASEDLRVLLFNEERGMAFKDPGLFNNIRSLMTDTELAVWNYMGSVDDFLFNATAHINMENETVSLINETETHLGEILSLLNASTEYNFSSIKEPFLRIYMSLYVSLRSDAWGLYAETGEKVWDDVEGMFLHAYYDAKDMLPAMVVGSLYPATVTATETVSTTVTSIKTETTTVSETYTSTYTSTTTRTETLVKTATKTLTSTLPTTIYKTRTATVTSPKTITSTVTQSKTVKTTETKIIPTTLTSITTTTLRETKASYLVITLIVGLVIGAAIMIPRRHG